MKKIFVLCAAVLALVNTPGVIAESFNQRSFELVETLSKTITTFAGHSATAELETLAADTEVIRAAAKAVVAFDIASEAPYSTSYAAASKVLKAATSKLETVSQKMAAAAKDDDEAGFVSYKNEYNSAVAGFKHAAQQYSTATEAAAQQLQFEHLLVIALVVAAGVQAIAWWLWATAGDVANQRRNRARRIVALASLVPLIATLASLVLYFLQLITGYWLWLPAAVSAAVPLAAGLDYLRRRKQLHTMHAPMR